MKKYLFLLSFLFACNDADRAHEVLQNQGYTNINMTGYAFFACSKDDMFADGFAADNPMSHAHVKGVVCCGLWKNCTIRFE